MRSDKLRFSIFCLVLACLVSIPIKLPVFQNLLDDKITYYFYATDLDFDFHGSKIKTCDEIKIMRNGNSVIVECDEKNANNVRSSLENVKGESVRITTCTGKKIADVLNKFQKYFVFDEYNCGYHFLYYYNGALDNFVFINNQKINIQIAINEQTINIGYPLILNGY